MYECLVWGFRGQKSNSAMGFARGFEIVVTVPGVPPEEARGTAGGRESEYDAETRGPIPQIRCAAAGCDA